MTEGRRQMVADHFTFGAEAACCGWGLDHLAAAYRGALQEFREAALEGFRAGTEALVRLKADAREYAHAIEAVEPRQFA